MIFRWCVFWDLYCAAPERRDHNDHSGEAKAFHDYSAHSQPPQPPIQEPHPAFHQFYPVSIILSILKS